jgi:PAS domain S-box-containing protein
MQAPFLLLTAFLLTTTLLGAVVSGLLLRKTRKLWRLLQQQQSDTGPHHSAERFRAICEHSEFGVVIADAEGRFTYANERYLELIDATLEEVRNGQWIDHLHPDDQATIRARWDEALRTRQGFVSERRGVTREGDISWANVHTSPIHAQDGSFRGFIITVEDITARKQAEASLRRSEARYARVFRLLPDVLTITDLSTGRYVEINQRWQGLIGYSPEEALGRTSVELDVWYDEDGRRNLIDALKDNGELSDYPVRFRHKDGHLVEVEVSGAILQLDGIPHLILISRDVAQRNALAKARDQVERALRESEQKFARVFQLLPDLIIISDADDGTYIDMNQQWTPMSGWTHEEAIGKTSLELGFWPSPDDRREMIRKLSAEGEVRQLEIYLRRKNGELFLTEYSGRFVEINNQRYLISIISDVSEQRRTELERIRALEAQSESERKFRIIFDQAFELIGILSLDGMLIEANRTAIDFSQTSLDKVLQRPFWDGPWWQHNAAQKTWLQGAIAEAAGGQLVRAETTHRDASGHRHTIDLSLKPVRDESGQVTTLMVEGRDITALKEAEEALRISEAKFSGAFHASLDYITISYLDTGKLLEVNEAFQQMTGWTREEVIGKTTVELGIWPFAEERQKLVAILDRQGYVREYLCRIGLRSGEQRDCLLNASTITVEDQVYLLGVIRDVTEKKRAEEALRESQQKFSRIFHLSPQPLAVTTFPQGRYLDVNEAWLKTFRFTRDEVVGHTSLEIGLWICAADRRRFLDTLGDNDSIDSYGCTYHTSERKALDCLTSGNLFTLNNERCLIWSVVDITLQREAQQRMEQINELLETRVHERTAELEDSNRELADALESLKVAQNELVRSEKLAALGSLVAGIAHELNTPIGNGVTVASTLVERTREFSETIHGGAIKRSTLNDYVEAATIASDLLLRNLGRARELVTSFKQVAIDQTSDQRRRFDLRTVIEEIVATLSPMTRKTPYRIELKLADDLTLDSYPGPLGQIITNFVTNALYHAFEGRPDGCMRISSRALPDDWVELIFSDDGKGIPEEHLGRIFDPFFTTKLGKGGSGLGLNIVHNIATRMLGGRLTVSSGRGQGTTFTLTMPVEAPHCETESPA